MKKYLLLFVALTSLSFGQEVIRPKVPSDTTLASPTSQIAAWYKYAVYVEGLLEAEKLSKQAALDAQKAVYEQQILTLKQSQINTILEKVSNIETFINFSYRINVPTAKTLVLTWKDNSTTETHFCIERSMDNISYTEIGRVAANITSYENVSVSAGLYYYRVRALISTSNVYSGYSEIVSITMK